MSTPSRLIPIYTTRGDVGGFLVYPYIFNRHGEWIGWIKPNKTVYSVHGHYVGILSKEPRILRKREFTYDQPRIKPPSVPQPIRPPAHVPLAPQMPELTLSTIDVLDEAPELLPAVDFGDLRDDLD